MRQNPILIPLTILVSAHFISRRPRPPASSSAGYRRSRRGRPFHPTTAQFFSLASRGVTVGRIGAPKKKEKKKEKAAAVG